MIEDTMQQAAQPAWPGTTPRPTLMAMCPMARMCTRMMEKPPSGFFLLLPGALLMLLGVSIFLEPVIVVWLAGTFSFLFGIMLLLMARFIGRLRNS